MNALLPGDRALLPMRSIPSMPSSSEPGASSSYPSRGGLLSGTAKPFNGVFRPRGNVVFAGLKELPNTDRGGGPAGVVDGCVRCEGGGPAGVVDGCVKMERFFCDAGVEGMSEDSGRRKAIAFVEQPHATSLLALSNIRIYAEVQCSLSHRFASRTLDLQRSRKLGPC